MKITRSILLITVIVISGACHVGRFFAWNVADLGDYKKFPAIDVKNSGETFRFTNTPDHDLFTDIPYNNVGHDLDSLLSHRSSKTIAFIVIRNDSILFEKYWDGYSADKPVPSFSVAKSFTSALVGIAIEEGKISSIDAKVSDYVPELCSSDPAFSELTIRHLLDMRSGIDFNESAFLNPFKGLAKLYYGKNLKKQVFKLELDGDPNGTYNYQSINTQLLGIVLERAVGMSPAEYLEEKIWIPLGMENPATWSIDSKKNRTVKTYCCLNATPRDYARFGRLYLNEGSWEGQQIVPRQWVERSITPAQPNPWYQNHWYSVGRPEYFEDSLSAIAAIGNYPYVRKSRRYPGKYYIRRFGPAFVASGLLGQYIYVEPEKNLIIVRLGKASGKIQWWQLFERIAEKM